jgi:hypothetical protein
MAGEGYDALGILLRDKTSQSSRKLLNPRRIIIRERMTLDRL